ncbi:DUF5988 family protein [Streptomyces sp. NPDC096012]|uniref:DUF5988 family protein n=1 Tax=Streptomyces sp. NPDC096012 TaxID=3155684 RepID=UPI00336A48B3
MASRCLLPSPFHRPFATGTTDSPYADEGKSAPESKAPGSVRVLLSGGPGWVAVPTVWEVASPRDEPQVKILCGNAYEHFEFSGLYSLHSGERLPVYRWCRRTCVAE